MLVGLAGAAGVALGACGDPAPTGATGATGSGTGTGTESRCAANEDGCPCDQAGATVSCGEIKKQNADYVWCSEGKRTCVAGQWGACIGDRITTKSAPMSSMHTLGIATASTPCPNPCDPNCKQLADDPIGLPLPADGGLSVVDGGLTITGAVSVGAACTSLVVTPSTAPATDLVINAGMAPPTPGSKLFTASLLPAGCYTGAVPALWSVDKFDIAQVVNGTMTVATPIAGPIAVTAYAGTLSATVTSNVTVNVVDQSAAPAGYTSASFPAPTGTADPNLDILYPYASTLFPLGLAPPLLMWRDATNPTVNAVKVTLRYPPTGAAIFSWSEIVPEKQVAPTPGIAARPRAQIPANVWFAFEQTVARNSGTLGNSAVFAIQRFVGAGPARAEVTRTIKFANGQLKGRILYNSYGTNLVANYGNTIQGTRFGAATLQIDPGASVPSVVAGTTSATNGPGCRVCHSVSSDGSTLVTNRFNPNDHTTSSYNLVTSTESLLGAATGDGRFTWPALSKDGSFLFTNSGPAALEGSDTTMSSRLYDAAGTPIPSATMPTTLKAATPVFAHDTSAIAFNFFSGTAAPLANPPSGPTSGDGKSLAMMSFNPATKAFSGFKNLYVAPGTGPGNGSACWPSFLPPTEGGLVFQREIRYNGRDFGGTRSECDASSGSCASQGTTSEIWWVNTTGAAQPRRLDSLNGWNGAASYLPTAANLHGNPVDATFNDNIYNYEPTVLPITAGGFSWVAFTSRRLYGNVATINPYWSDPRFQYLNVEPTPKKLWISALATSPGAGTDPSNPPFYLPGQELLAGNARAYFVLDACKQPGAPTAANVCETTADCCQSPTASVCQLDPPPLSNPPARHCVASGGAGCKADGLACTTDIQCCGFATGSRCASGKCVLPPPLVSYGPQTFSRTFVADCAPGTRVKWRFFDWQSITPIGTSIDFTAQTSESGGPLLPAAPIGIGQAIAPPIATSTWTSAALTVDQLLLAAGEISRPVLRVSMTFNPKTSVPTAAPILTNWRQAFDCTPSE